MVSLPVGKVRATGVKDNEGRVDRGSKKADKRIEGSASLGDISLKVPNVEERALVMSTWAAGSSGLGLEFDSNLSCNKARAALSQKRELKRRVSGLELRFLLAFGSGRGIGSTMVVSRVIESGSAK